MAMFSKRKVSVQEAVAPSPGGDSTYGIESVSEWGHDSAASLSSDDLGRVDEADIPAASGLGLSQMPTESTEQEVAAPGDAADIQESLRSPSSPAYQPHSGAGETSPIRPAALLPSPSIAPPSPEETVHPLQFASTALSPPAISLPISSTSPSRSPSYLPGSPMDLYPPSDIESESSLSLSLTSLRDLHVPISEPGSPSSNTSLPSYVPSLSSLSRTSSPNSASVGNGARVHPSHLHLSQGLGMGMGIGLASLLPGGLESSEGSGDLVLPTLSLPSSSLHLSLPRWTGEHDGIKVALLGDSAHIKRIIRELGEHEQVVQLNKGDIGVVRDSKVVLILMIGLTSEQVRTNSSVTVYTDQLRYSDGYINPIRPCMRYSIRRLFIMSKSRCRT